MSEEEEEEEEEEAPDKHIIMILCVVDVKASGLSDHRIVKQSRQPGGKNLTTLSAGILIKQGDFTQVFDGNCTFFFTKKLKYKVLHMPVFLSLNSSTQFFFM